MRRSKTNDLGGTSLTVGVTETVAVAQLTAQRETNRLLLALLLATTGRGEIEEFAPTLDRSAYGKPERKFGTISP